jgi:hypothetical protein
VSAVGVIPVQMSEIFFSDDYGARWEFSVLKAIRGRMRVSGIGDQLGVCFPHSDTWCPRQNVGRGFAEAIAKLQHTGMTSFTISCGVLIRQRYSVQSAGGPGSDPPTPPHDQNIELLKPPYGSVAPGAEASIPFYYMTTGSGRSRSGSEYAPILFTPIVLRRC